MIIGISRPSNHKIEHPCFTSNKMITHLKLAGTCITSSSVGASFLRNRSQLSHSEGRSESNPVQTSLFLGSLVASAALYHLYSRNFINFVNFENLFNLLMLILINFTNLIH